MESPPNFSNNASAKTKHSMVSAIIDAAGTAQESVRSLWASFSFFEFLFIGFDGLEIYVGLVLSAKVFFC